MKTAVRSLLGLGLLLGGGAAGGQTPVAALELRTDPAGARVRPFENLVIQVLVYADVKDGGKTKRVRLQKDGVRLRITDPKGGWLSKPFRYQGRDTEPFYQAEGGRLRAILGEAASEFVLQDAVLFTAPERPGKYKIEAQLDDKTCSITIRVDRSAPRRPDESTQFKAEARPRDPYRKLAECYAPFVAQETWFEPKADYLARFDFDGDWRGDNNWDNAERGSSQAYVYYAAMETQTHWFLIYNLFHPRDYSDKCVAGTCHENDNEGLILTIAKDGSSNGKLVAMETLAHNNVYSYRADRRVEGNAHNIDGEMELYQGSHPMIFVESGGHGIYGCTDRRARFAPGRGEFISGTGVTYLYKGAAERPKYPNDRNVGYELLPVYDHWWKRAQERGGGNRAFDAYYVYSPFGGRPRPPQSTIAGSFLGRKFGSNKAKPFWGWHDSRTEKRKILATGQWGLDPAYAVSQDLRLPEPMSLDYVFNPYLGVEAPASPELAASTVAGGAADELGEVHPKRSRNYDPEAKRGQFDLRVMVDGQNEFFIHGDTVSYRIGGGRPPSDAGSEYTQPIPRATFRRFKAEKKDGRGDATLLEEPSPQNDFTARVRISDPRGGSDRYHVRLEWEWDKRLPPPAAAASTANPSGEFEFCGRVDGTAVFRIRGGQAAAEAVDGQPVQLDHIRFSEPLPASNVKDIRVAKTEGRGEVVLLEKPWAGNDFQAVVRVSDPKGGDAAYCFALQWTK